MTWKNYIALLLLAVSPALTAAGRYRYASRDTEHYFGLYAEGAYSTMPLWNMPELQAQKGYGVGGGVLYELQHDRFLMDIGCGFLWQRADERLLPMIEWHDPQVDTRGTDYILDTYIRRRDRVRRGAIDIPLLMGMDMGTAYFLTGIKAGIGVIGDVNMHTNVTTMGTYDQYFIPISETDDHGYRNMVDLHPQSAPMTFIYDVRLSAEFGVWLLRAGRYNSGRARCRLAAFADFGLFMGKADLNPTSVSRDYAFNFDQYTITPLASPGTTAMRSNVLAGLKLTLLIGGGDATSPHGKCWSCHMVRDDFKPHRFRHKCMICESEDRR